MENKEQLINFFLSGEIHLSKNDYSFFFNIHNLIKVNKFVTSNQTKLLDKLIYKYQRQIKKNDLDIENLINLPWTCEVKNSLEEFTKAHIKIENQVISIRSPFNKNFVKEIKSDDVADFQWDKEQKIYKAPFTTYSFKFAVTLCNKFHDVTLCDSSVQIVKQLDGLQNKIWDPTLVNVNGHFYIAATNQFLDEYLKDVTLNLSPISLTKIGKAGVKISSQNDPKLDFCSSPIVTIDSRELKNICLWLLESNIKYVYINSNITNKKFFQECKTIIESHGLMLLGSNTLNNFNDQYAYIKSTTYYERYDDKIAMMSPSKVIILKNSTPIHVV
jgi:hypothetical protein